jgi:hypothetical protein
MNAVSEIRAKQEQKEREAEAAGKVEADRVRRFIGVPRCEIAMASNAWAGSLGAWAPPLFSTKD